MKNPLALAAARAELEALRKKVVEISKGILGLVRSGTLPDLTQYIDATKSLDELSKSEGARSIAHMALIVALETNKMVKELREEQKEMRKKLGEKNESSV